jgi:hypothetical protein
MLTAWEQAFGLMETLGCCGAGDVVVDGIRTAPPGRGDVVDAWVAIGERLNAIVEASRTQH